MMLHCDAPGQVLFIVVGFCPSGVFSFQYYTQPLGDYARDSNRSCDFAVIMLDGDVLPVDGVIACLDLGSVTLDKSTNALTFTPSLWRFVSSPWLIEMNVIVITLNIYAVVLSTGEVLLDVHTILIGAITSTLDLCAFPVYSFHCGVGHLRSVLLLSSWSSPSIRPLHRT
jgi:hypothetical protein